MGLSFGRRDGMWTLWTLIVEQPDILGCVAVVSESAGHDCVSDAESIAPMT